MVSIVPMLIGEPVAFTPGLGPHEDVLPDPVLAALVVPLALELVALDAPLAPLLALLVLLPLEAGALVLLLDLLELPHAATAKQAQIAATTRKSLLFSKLGTSS